MKYLVIFLFLILIGLLNSCNNPQDVIYTNVRVENEIAILKKTFDNNGNLVIEEILNKDSINDGFYKEWNIGKLQSSGTYHMGKREGKWFYMDLGGDTIKVENWFSGKKFGNQYEYFSAIQAKETPPIYKFSFLNLDEQEVSSIQFDVNQNVVKSDGLPLYCAYNKDLLKKDSTYELVCFWGCPPDLRFKLTIKESTINGGSIQTKEITDDNGKFEVLDFANKFSIEKKYLAKGSYKWKIFLAITDKASNQVIKDSCVINLNVK